MYNKWKIAFWSCFLILILVLIGGLLYLFSTEMRMGFMRENMKSYKSDLGKTITIINKDLKTKTQIEDEFRFNGYSPFTNGNNDTAQLLRTDYVFRNDTLVKIRMRD